MTEPLTHEPSTTEPSTTEPSTTETLQSESEDLKSAPFMEHLAELRTRLIWSFTSIFVLFIVCFIFVDDIFNYLIEPFKQAAEDITDVELIYTGPLEFVITKIKVAFFGAVFLAFPVIATQVYKFVAPGLYKNERRAFLPFLLVTPVLFLTGASLIQFIVMPLALEFLLSMEQAGGPDQLSIQMTTRVSEYLSFAMTLLLAFGICFQLPVVMTLLARAGLVEPDQLRKWRKYALVGILVIAALLTPPEPITQLGLAIPLVLLYELSIFAVSLVHKRNLAREKEMGLHG